MAEKKELENKEVIETEVKENAEAAAAETKAQKESTAANRAKKAERREAKAARKEANKIEEKKSRPNNLLLAILIFGVLIGMFAFVKGYTYYKLEPSIQSYIKNNGGEDTYGSMMIDEHTTASVTAKKNNMNIDITCTPHEGEEKEFEEYYNGEDGEKQMKYIGAYMLTTIKPETRGLSANVKVTVKINDKEVKSISMTYNEAKRYLKELEKESEEEAAEAATEEAATEEAAAEEVVTDDAAQEVEVETEAEDDAAEETKADKSKSDDSADSDDKAE